MNKCYYIVSFIAALFVVGNTNSQTNSLNISGYGQVDYNQELDKEKFKSVNKTY